jgi:hypothetical protein
MRAVDDGGAVGAVGAQQAARGRWTASRCAPEKTKVYASLLALARLNVD